MPTQRVFMTHQNALHALLPSVIDAIRVAGHTLRERFSNGDAIGHDIAKLIAAVDANDAAVEDKLRGALRAARPGSGWIDDDEAGGALPPGEWWVADCVEGNVNHVHGGTAWGVTAALVLDGVPVLAVVYEPLSERLTTAIRGGGAWCDGVRLQVSDKRDLAAALVGTGQARPGEGPAVHAAIAASVHTMLNRALLVRMAVPATFEIVDVASGRLDAFWQYTQVRSGLAAGVLLAREAGAAVTDTRGQPWDFSSEDILLAAPGLHAAVVASLTATVTP
jgi:myo-inositol-1(or 4)-monophosphatase